MKLMNMSLCNTRSHPPVTPSTSRLSWQRAVPCRALILAIPGQDCSPASLTSGTEAF